MLSFILCTANIPFSNILRYLIKTNMKDVSMPYKVSSLNDNFTTYEDISKDCLNIINIYIIDTKLNEEINGIELAKFIRKYDYFAYIILITDDSELPIKIFQWNLRVLDYIQKNNDDFKLRISNCLNTIITESKPLFNLYSLNNNLLIKSHDTIYNIKQNDILYIETNVVTKKLILHTNTSVLSFKCTLEKCQLSLGKNFIRSHRAYIVNINHIKKLNLSSMTILMSNNDICLLSTRKLPIFKELCL